jgi:hypothetical protein
MPARGRPRITPADLQTRIAEYCQRYGVTPNAEGLPPFPAGQRETRQHREWISAYKAHSRLARRLRGQCERCAAPVSEGSVFCELHRAHVSDRATDHDDVSSSVDDRRPQLDVQEGRCPVCARKLDLRDAVDHTTPGRGLRAVLHPACHRMLGLAEAVGPEGVDRLRTYLWPDDPLPHSRRNKVGKGR